MKPPPLQLHKLVHALKVHGVKYTFTRKAVDEFGEPIKGAPPVEVAKPSGIYSEAGTGFILVVSDAATVQSKPTPTITTLLADAVDIRVEDTVFVPPGSDRRYKVTSVDDAGNLGYFANITLEVFLNGIPV